MLVGQSYPTSRKGRYHRSTKFIDDIQSFKTDNFEQLMSTSHMSATDGSGGPEWVPRDIRKVGAAAATIKMHENEGEPIKVLDIAFVASEVPGEQTVPRAELFGDIMANRSNEQ